MSFQIADVFTDDIFKVRSMMDYIDSKAVRARGDQ